MKCLICGKNFRILNNCHLRIHKISCKEYEKKFNVKLDIPENIKKEISKTVKKTFKDNPDIIKNGVEKWKEFFKTQKGQEIQKETNKKRSKTLKGRKKKPFTKEHRENISKATKRQYEKQFPWGRRKSSKIHLRLKEEISKHLSNFKSEQFIRLKEEKIWICADELDRKKKIALFVDGAHWHAKDYNDDFIVRPINKTAKELRAKDAMINKALKRKGYIVLRFWDEEIKNNLQDCIKKILIVTKRRYGESQ